MRSLLASVAVLFGMLLVSHGRTETRLDDQELFTKRVWPILKEDCLKCHGGLKVRNGLDVSTREDLLRGGDHGPAIIPGDPERSLLIHSVRYEGEYQMPPNGKLRPEQINDLVEWVKRGAPWPSR